mmetsp:Transcript_1613/g.5202  ORF Transcript_1613/g.5202 Transcript_1613/m.5202 type:complete len:297 (+) Transcript_1613:84-974(+)
MPAGYLAILAEKEAAHEKMIGQIKEAMATFDADGDGKLTLEELTKALCSTGTEKDPARVKSMFKECDKNKNGTVESDEFILRHKVKFLPTPCGGPPCAAFVKVRREQEKKGDSALPSAANPPSQNPVKAAWKFFAENLLWIGTGPNYGLVSVNVSPGKFQVLYESVMNFKNQEGLLKYVWFRDLTKGQWDKDGKPTEQNPVGKLCDQAAKTVGSLKLFGACTPLGKPLGNGLVEVSVGPQSSPLVYVSVLKPGMGLVTGQVLGPVAGFTQNQDGKVVGLNGDNTKIVYPDPPFTTS